MKRTRKKMPMMTKRRKRPDESQKLREGLPRNPPHTSDAAISPPFDLTPG